LRTSSSIAIVLASLVLTLDTVTGGRVFMRSTSPAVAGSAHSPVVASAGVSMDQAVKMVEQRFRARVVRVETQHDGSHKIYVLRLLNDAGHVWTVRVDAANGEVL